MNRVVYVGGYGRSGSSLVDRLVASKTGGFSGGELFSLFAWAENGQKCSCGVPVNECPFWRPIIVDAVDATGDTLAALSASLIDSEFRRHPTSQWRLAWTSVFRSLSDCGFEIVVDSSKNANGRRRARMLNTLNGVEVIVFLHVHRRLPAVLHSRLKGNNRALESQSPAPRDRLAISRAILGWVIANLYASWSGPRSASDYISLSYEKIVETNGSALFDLIGEMSADSIGNPAEAFHNISGNRILRSGEAINIRFDERWRKELPFALRVACVLIERPTIVAMRVVSRISLRIVRARS
ncbi:hypothetical protein ABIE38_002598 [Dietzia sp. 2505]